MLSWKPAISEDLLLIATGDPVTLLELIMMNLSLSDAISVKQERVWESIISDLNPMGILVLGFFTEILWIEMESSILEFIVPFLLVPTPTILFHSNELAKSSAENEKKRG
ncbi:hypothetical protein UH38_06335 [Aliterella atlantica CENA595]|uniref:Uncharacterized protein n=1 Tax=Aliterella atlantica CENA595 TaxID=1618023 RepID=A0A0D8ZVH5_9CYAN|nr:hypothetical protein UH38_06335 [Aliterella atlantica CENA595]